MTSAAARTHARPQVRETRKSQATRSRILDAAMRVIAEEGYHAANNARIAEAAAVVRGVINYHFRDHAHFLEGIVDHVEHRKAACFREMASRLSRSSADHVDEAIDAYWSLLHEEPFVVFAELEYAARTDRALRRLLARPRRSFDHGLAASGALDPDGPGPDPNRQTLYDLSRFLLEGLSRGVMTYDAARRQARLLALLKTAVKALDGSQTPRPLWVE